jgi:hypothetical protein
MIQSSKSLTIEMWVANDKFRDGWDRIFGKKEDNANSPSEEHVPSTDQQIDADSEHCTNDTVVGVCRGCNIKRGDADSCR